MGFPASRPPRTWEEVQTLLEEMDSVKTSVLKFKEQGVSPAHVRAAQQTEDVSPKKFQEIRPRSDPAGFQRQPRKGDSKGKGKLSWDRESPFSRAWRAAEAAGLTREQFAKNWDATKRQQEGEQEGRVLAVDQDPLPNSHEELVAWVARGAPTGKGTAKGKKGRIR